jgi:hypothetical protein
MSNNRWLKGRYRPQNPNKYKGDIDKIVYRSSWERTFMVWADTDEDILAWSSEETKIQYFDPVKKCGRIYVVDFKILTRKPDGGYQVILIEIKPEKQTKKPRDSRNKAEKTLLLEQATYQTNVAKWRAAIKFCDDRGWKFKILTEVDLFGGIDRGYKPQKPAR